MAWTAAGRSAQYRVALAAVAVKLKSPGMDLANSSIKPNHSHLGDYILTRQNVIKNIAYPGNTRFTAMPAPKDPQKQTSEDEAAQNVEGPLEKASWFGVAVREGFYVLPPQKPPHGEISQAFAELRTLVRFSRGVLDAFDESSRDDPGFIESEALVQSIQRSKLHQRVEVAMRHMEFLEELHSRVPLLEEDVEEFNFLSNQFKEQRQRFYKWCKLAARVEEGILVPIYKTEGEHQRVKSVRRGNSKEKFRATAIRFVARTVFALLIGLLIFKIRW